MGKKSESLSFITTLIFVVFIINHVFNILNQVQKLQYMGMLTEYDGAVRGSSYQLSCYYNIMVSLVVIALLYFVSCKKKWAVWTFFAFQLINPVVICTIMGTYSDLGVHLFVSIVICVLFCLLLLIRNNGKSGWKLIFRSNNSEENND